MILQLFCFLFFSLKKNPEAEAEVEEDEQLIEVTGYKKTQDIGVLKLYFENPLRSGGGEIETIGRDPKTGAVRITFKNPLGKLYHRKSWKFTMCIG